MTYGYSQSLVTANKEASARSLGVALGRVCIKVGISVSEVATVFGVSRMAIYNWFKGVSAPKSTLNRKIETYIHTIKRRHNLN